MKDKKQAGLVVKTQTGRIGRTFHNKRRIDRKIQVYLFKEDSKNELSGEKLLCKAETLTMIGFID
jgi:hypothetical protein